MQASELVVVDLREEERRRLETEAARGELRVLHARLGRLGDDQVRARLLGGEAQDAVDGGVVLRQLRLVDAAEVAWQADFAAAAAAAAERAARGELDGHRAAMKRYARDRFLWKHVAEKWEAHFLGRAT